MNKIIPILAAGGPLLFRQLFESVSSTYTYLLADAQTREAVLIDTVLETVERDAKLVSELNLKLSTLVDTHVHADHVTGAGMLKRRFPGSISILGKYDNVSCDRVVNHGDIIKFGKFSIECRSTPGHTVGCLSLVVHDAGLVFTGDALLIRGCGRTDFQGGSASELYDSVHAQILSLPDEFMLFPAHNYSGLPYTTVGEEKALNPRFSRPKAEFIEIMNSLNLAPPKQLDRALRLNVKCGIED